MMLILHDYLYINIYCISFNYISQTYNTFIYINSIFYFFFFFYFYFLFFFFFIKIVSSYKQTKKSHLIFLFCVMLRKIEHITSNTISSKKIGKVTLKKMLLIIILYHYISNNELEFCSFFFFFFHYYIIILLYLKNNFIIK